MDERRESRCAIRVKAGANGSKLLGQNRTDAQADADVGQLATRYRDCSRRHPRDMILARSRTNQGSQSVQTHLLGVSNEECS